MGRLVKNKFDHSGNVVCFKRLYFVHTLCHFWLIAGHRRVNKSKAAIGPISFPVANFHANSASAERKSDQKI
jgi:hypothetical protein